MWQTSRAICTVLLVGTLCFGTLGCGKQTSVPNVTENKLATQFSTEPSFDRQLDSVRTGSASRIQITESKVTSEQLLLLASVRHGTVRIADRRGIDR